jgi:hypothetical protein
MTGAAFSPEARELLHRGPNETIEKPFDVRSPPATVQRLLRR